MSCRKPAKKCKKCRPEPNPKVEELQKLLSGRNMGCVASNISALNKITREESLRRVEALNSQDP